MTSDTNNDPVETIKKLYEAFGSGDVPTLISYLADDIKWDVLADDDNKNQSITNGKVPWFQPRHGKDEVTETFAVLAENLKFTKFDITSLLFDGKYKVAAEISYEFDVIGSNGHLRDDEIHLWTFDSDGNKVIQFRHFVDTEKHIAAYNGEKFY
jgi:uncharacterized protein